MRFLTFLLGFIIFCLYAQAGLRPVDPDYPGNKKTSDDIAAGHILTFRIPQQLATEIIDETNHAIYIVVHAGTNLTALTPTITVTAGSTVTPASGVPQNFTSAVGYTVDGLTFYSVNVLKARSPTPICNGASTTLTGDPPGAVPGTYTWETLASPGNWVAAPGANTGADYSTGALASNPTTAKVYSFRRKITTAFGAVYDSYNDVTVNPSVPIASYAITQPSPGSFCVSGNVGIINGELPTGGNGTYTYQWQISTDFGANFNNIPGANAQLQNYVPPTLTATTLYQRITSSGTCSPPALSNIVTVTIVPAVTNNMLFEPATTSFCDQSTPIIINGNIPSGGTGTIQYQWQSSVNGAPFADIPGAGTTGNDYDVPVLTQSTSFRRSAMSGACSTPVYSNVINISIVQSISSNAITLHPPDTFCAGGQPETITGNGPGGGNGTLIIQWMSCTDNINFQPISGATDINYTPLPINVTTYYRRYVTSGPCTVPNIGNVITLTVIPAITGNTINNPAVTSFCVTGDPANITGITPTGGNGTYKYQWQSCTDNVHFTNISGATNDSYDPGTITATTYYQRTVTSGICNTPSPSNVITITVLPAVSNNTIAPPPITAFCASGEPDNIIGSPPAGGSGNYYYQWQSSVDNINFNDIVGETRKDYAPNEINVTTYYRRNVSSDICTIPQASNVITITVYPAIGLNTITAPPVTSFCVSGNPANIQGNPPTGGNGTYSIKWQSCTDNIHFTDIAGATAASYDPGTINVTTYYRRTITSGLCDVPSVSSAIPITIVPVLANNTITPPTQQTFCANGDAGSITGRIPTGGDGNYTYLWQQSVDNVDAHFTTISGEVGKDLDPPALTSTMFYRRIVTAGVCTTPLVSSAVEIHITPAVTANTISSPPVQYCVSVDPGIISGSPDLSTDPRDVYQYKWYTSPDKLTWTLIVGATGDDYDPPTITATTYYRRDITSGACTVPVQSTLAKIAVNNTPANVTVDPVAPICAGNFTTLNVNSPDPDLTYTWYDSPSKDHSVSENPSYITNPLNAPTTFYVEATNPGGCSSPVLTSVTVQVNNAPDAPILVQNPVPVCEGTPADLKVLNPQSALIYKWYTTPTGTTPVFTQPEFLTSPIINNTTYYVEATNSTGCASPRTAVNITTIAAPQVTAQGTSVCPGGTATVTAVGSDPNVVINWYATPTGGTSLSGNASFNITSVNANVTYYAEGSYTNSDCVSVTRSPAQVTVLQPLATPVVSVQSATISTVTFSWPAVTGASGYLVSMDGGQTFNYPSSGSTGTTHTVTGLALGQSVTIVVRASGTSDCQLSDKSIEVTGIPINPLADVIFVANAFTPNGDGKNDIIYVHNENIKSLKFYVYDQWGQLLYVSLSQQNGWDGSYKGKAEPAGVYVYYLEAILKDGKQVNKKGTITLLR